MPFKKHSEKNAWSEHEESSGERVGEKPSSGQKTKRHCTKWWWLYLLLLIIVVVVVVIPIIYVAFPKMAQSSVNQATVTVDSMSATNPLADAFDLQINTTVDSHSSHEATVQGFNASFYLLDTKPDIKPFVYADFPAVKSSDTLVNITQRQVPVADMDQFIAYNTLVLNSEEFQLGVRGDTKVLISGLPKYGVTYDKVVTMKGFNKFAGFSIDTVEFHLLPEFDGATMTGTVSIPNPSVITAQFGNVTMDLYANGTYLGYSLLEYVELKPGNNTFDMRSYVNLTLALEYVHDNLLDLQLQGNSSVNIIGQHLIYYEEALKTNPINYQLNITRATGAGS